MTSAVASRSEGLDIGAHSVNLVVAGARMPERVADQSTGEQPDPMVGRVLADRFRIIELIARGGMGRVYKAEQLPLGRTVALKVLVPAERRPDDELAFRRRFEREASISAALTHSNTVRIFDYGWTDDGVYFLAMEYLQGRTLQQVIRSEAPLPAWRVVRVLKQMCASLGEAHAHGIVHRDLKPGNVILTSHADDREFVKIVDFGLVKRAGDTDITQAGMIVGSPMYMSPEQIRGDDTDARSDVYALGVIAFAMLTGKRPFERDSPMAIFVAQLSVEPPRMADLVPGLKIPKSLEWLVSTCLSPSKEHRLENAWEVGRVLRVVEAELTGEHGGLTLDLRNGKAILPAGFSDASNPSMARAVHDTSGSSVTRTGVAAAGASFVLVLLVGIGGFAVLGAGITAWWMSRPAVPPIAAVPVPVPAAAPAPVPVPAAAAPVDPAPVAPEPASNPAPTPVASPRQRPRTAPSPAPAPVAAPVPPPAPPAQDRGWKNDSDLKDPFGH